MPVFDEPGEHLRLRPRAVVPDDGDRTDWMFLVIIGVIVFLWFAGT